MPGSRFDPLEFLPAETYSKVTDVRVASPDVLRRAALARRRRRRIAPDGKLALLAADHPARMITGIRDDPLRMGRRREFLSRILRVMGCSPFDGLLGTADVVDDLLAVGDISKRSILDGKLLLGSVNRGGLSGSSFELDDAVTGYDVEGAVRMRLDGVKFLLRFDPTDPESLKTLTYCVEVVRACEKRKMPLFLEPLPVVKKDGKVKMEAEKSKLVRLVGAASALGSSSGRIWLKLPYCQGFEEVAGATTLPILLLGGEASDDVLGLLREIESGMKAGPNVRGVLMGRNLLYPQGDDPLPLAIAVHSIVHEGKKAEDALGEMPRHQGKDLGVFRSND